MRNFTIQGNLRAPLIGNPDGAYKSLIDMGFQRYPARLKAIASIAQVEQQAETAEYAEAMLGLSLEPMDRPIPSGW
jgi:hypothetical protein